MLQFLSMLACRFHVWWSTFRDVALCVVSLILAESVYNNSDAKVSHKQTAKPKANGEYVSTSRAVWVTFVHGTPQGAAMLCTTWVSLRLRCVSPCTRAGLWAVVSPTQCCRASVNCLLCLLFHPPCVTVGCWQTVLFLCVPTGTISARKLEIRAVVYVVCILAYKKWNDKALCGWKATIVYVQPALFPQLHLAIRFWLLPLPGCVYAHMPVPTLSSLTQMLTLAHSHSLLYLCRLLMSSIQTGQMCPNLRYVNS